MSEQRDNEQDLKIQDNAERITRNEEAIQRQTEALEQIRDHYYPPPEKAWRKVFGFLAKIFCAVLAYLGIAETVDWIWNVRESNALAAQYAEIADRLFREEGDAVSAQSCYEKAIELDENESEYVTALTYMKGMAMVNAFYGVTRPLTDEEKERIAGVLAEATVLRELDPENPMPHVLVAQAQLVGGDVKEAIPSVERAVACAPDLASVRVSACAINFFARRYDEARRELAEAERLNASLPYVAAWRSMLALRVDRDAATARKWAEEAIRRSPRSPNFHLLLGQSILAEAKPDLAAARAAFQQTLALDAKRLPAVLGMAETYEREGNLRVARKWLDRAIAADENLLPAFASRARVNLKLGDAKAADEDLTAAIALDPLRADLYRQRADVRAKAGDADGEREDRADAAALDQADAVKKNSVK